jgi:hypothetical protein
MSDSTDQNAGQAATPYERLGVSSDAGFDVVQLARQARLDELGDDPIARSRVEAAYDAVLMDRLKERQQGRVSTAARSASAREQVTPSTPRLSLPTLPKLPAPSLSLSRPSMALVEGEGRWLAGVGYGALLVLWLLLPSTSAEFLLALGTALAVVCLQRRRSRFLAAIGWAFAALILGLVLGAVVLGLASAALPLGLPLSPAQVQSLPALVLLALAALFVA